VAEIAAVHGGIAEAAICLVGSAPAGLIGAVGSRSAPRVYAGLEKPRAVVDRIELAELMTAVAGREVTAADLPPGSELPPGQPEGLGTMFAEYDRHGFHGGNSLVLRAILGREPRSMADYVAELGQAPTPARPAAS
jgi:hypothetical protein